MVKKTLWVCDRCFVRQSHRPMNSVAVNLSQGGMKKYDLCVSCLEEFREWMKVVEEIDDDT